MVIVSLDFVVGFPDLILREIKHHERTELAGDRYRQCGYCRVCIFDETHALSSSDSDLAAPPFAGVSDLCSGELLPFKTEVFDDTTECSRYSDLSIPNPELQRQLLEDVSGYAIFDENRRPFALSRHIRAF